MQNKRLTVLLVFVSLLIVGCQGTGAPQPAIATAPSPVVVKGAGPGELGDLPAPPSPTVTVPSTGATLAPPGGPESPSHSLPAKIHSASSVVTELAPGWMGYDSINQIVDLAFAPDGSLWAATRSGLVHWDLDTGTYTRQLLVATRVAVAPDGSLWLATEQGVCHLHGEVCDTYTEADGLLLNAVGAVVVAPDGTVWLGAAGGASRFDGQTWKSYPAPTATQDLAIGAAGEMWAATAGGLGRYLPSQDGWATYTEEQGLPASNVIAVATGQEGEVWAYVLWEGIYRFDGTNWHTVGQVPGGIVSDIALSEDGTLWSGTVGSLHYPGGGLARLDGDTWIDVSSARGLHSIRRIALGPEGALAVSTNLGLGVFEDGGWRLLKDGPTSGKVTTVAVTPDGAAWFGFGDHSVSTPGSGVSRFDGQEWRHFLADGEVSVLAAGPDGSLWAGVGPSVQRYDGIAWNTVGRCCEDLPQGNVLDIAFSTDGRVWIATGMGLASFDGQAWTSHDKLASSLVAAPDGALWISGWEGVSGSQYVARFDGIDWATYATADSYPGGFMIHAVTPDGLLWGISPEQRLASFDGGSWTDEDSWALYDTAGGVSLEGVRRLSGAPDGALWMSVDGGVARFDWQSPPDKEWVIYAVEDGLGPDHLGPMAFAPDGSAWFGAIRLQPSKAEAVWP